MPVAKSYQHLTTVGEPFKESGRMYILVQAPKGEKKVRWYSDAEYQKMYPDEKPIDIMMTFNARHAFGFGEKGYILIYKGDNVEEWFENDHTNIWYNLTFGYYTPSKFEPPKVLMGVEAVKLTWDEVKQDDIHMKSHAEVAAYVSKLLGGSSNTKSEFQGQKDEWLQKEVKIREKKTKESQFGTKHTYTMDDAEGNTYVWETGAKDYSCDAAVSLKMKVKEHKEIGGEKVTVVWYCKEV